MNKIQRNLSALDNGVLASINQKHYKRLEGLFNGHTPKHPFCLSGISVSTSDPDIEPDEWFAASILALSKQVSDACDELIFRPMSICYNPRGVHFVDDLFGAEVFLHSFSQQWQVRPFQRAVGTLQRPDLETNIAWSKVRDVARLFSLYDPPNVFFELPTLSSALNIAVNLYGEEILVAMLTNPDAAHHDLRVINDVIKELHTWFIQHLPADRFQLIATSGRFQPSGHGQICGCTTQLVSQELYDEFVASLDSEVLSLYPGGGLIHLCGAHTHHIPIWSSRNEVKCIQLNDRAALDLGIFFRELRNDQILYVNYFDDMPLDKVLDITGGKRLVLAGEFNESDGAKLN